MTNIYLAQYAFNGDEDSMRDDASDWENGASPRAVSVALELTDDWVNALKSQVEKEYLDFYSELMESEFILAREWKSIGKGRDGDHDAYLWEMMIAGEREALLILHEREQWDTEH